MSNLSKTFTNMRSRNDKEALSRQKIVHTATIKTALDSARLQNCVAELSRFKYLRRMESLRERRTFELGEVMLASLHGIRAYFHHASDLTNGLTPKLARLQATQAEKRADFRRQQEPWNGREHKLKSHIGEATAAVQTSQALLNAVNEGTATGVGTTLIEQGDESSVLKVEEESGIWKIGSALNNSSLYSRTPAKGVITGENVKNSATQDMYFTKPVDVDEAEQTIPPLRGSLRSPPLTQPSPLSTARFARRSSLSSEGRWKRSRRRSPPFTSAASRVRSRSRRRP
jgi:hypothetical protein